MRDRGTELCQSVVSVLPWVPGCFLGHGDAQDGCGHTLHGIASLARHVVSATALPILILSSDHFIIQVASMEILELPENSHAAA